MVSISLPPDIWFSIDPGEVHCGVTCWIYRTLLWQEDMSPELMWRQIWAEKSEYVHLGTKMVVSEAFRLYPGLAKAQSFSQLKVVETIGVIRYLCKKQDILHIEQAATIKKPIAAQLKAKKIKLRGKNQHMRDSELHGYYWLMKNKLLQG